MIRKLTLKPDVFLWRNGSDGLLYDAKQGTQRRFDVTESIGALCETLENPDNLYSVTADFATADAEVRNFVDGIVSAGFGALSEPDAPVISLPPLLNIQRDVERLRRDKERGIGENVLPYLLALRILVGGPCCDKPYYKQVLYPVCSDEVLTAERIARFLDAACTPSLQRIDIVVSDPSELAVTPLADALVAHKGKIAFHFLLAGLNEDMTVPAMLVERGYGVRLICEASGRLIEKRMFGAAGIGWDFIVRSLQEYNDWRRVIADCNPADYTFRPVYDDNPEFFDRNVFLDERDLQELQLSRREVFAHQAINTEAFGRLIVMPDGRVYSDVTAEALGTIEDSIYDLIIRELEANHAWRKVRDSKKCRNCIYRWLCPSPSPYERAAGRETICTLK